MCKKRQKERKTGGREIIKEAIGKFSYVVGKIRIRDLAIAMERKRAI